MTDKFEKFVDWAHEIYPEWVGVTVFVSVVFIFCIVASFVFVAVIYVTKGWFFLAIPVFVLYAWYIALFKQ